MNTGNSLNEQYFKDVYQNNEDPWSFETSEYERNKYQATIAALSRERYRSAFEIGCSIGVLSEMLATRCDRLLSVDVSDLPLQKARQRLEHNPRVTVQKMTVPEEFPHELFDLILLSEVGYYWSEKDLQKACGLILAHLQPGGQLLLVHWTPFVHDYPLTGDQVHDLFLALCKEDGPLLHLKGSREETYRLDLFERR